MTDNFFFAHAPIHRQALNTTWNCCVDTAEEVVYQAARDRTVLHVEERGHAIRRRGDLHIEVADLFVGVVLDRIGVFWPGRDVRHQVCADPMYGFG